MLSGWLLEPTGNGGPRRMIVTGVTLVQNPAYTSTSALVWLSTLRQLLGPHGWTTDGRSCPGRDGVRFSMAPPSQDSVWGCRPTGGHEAGSLGIRVVH